MGEMDHPSAGDFAWAAARDANAKIVELESRLAALTERVVDLENALGKVQSREGNS